jgi:hypothetical protein
MESMQVGAVQQKQKSGIDSFGLKIIAIVAMALNHFGHAFAHQLPYAVYCICIGAGGLTFPTMAYLIVVGYQYTRNVFRYALRIGVFSLISLLPFIWLFGSGLNVMFTLLLGLLIIWADDRLSNGAILRVLFYLLFAVAVYLTRWCDWSYIGVPMVLLYHRGRGKGWQTVAPVILVWSMAIGSVLETHAMGLTWPVIWYYCLPSLLYCFVGASATVPLLMNYNGERGRPMQYFFYAFYPGHLTVLAILRGLIFGIWKV